MSRRPTRAEISGNRILSLLPDADLEPLLREGRHRRLRRHETLQEPEEPIGEVYFPTSGSVISLLSVLSGGQTVEVASIGREGMAGLPVFLGARVATTRTMVQVPGVALALPSDALRGALRREGPLRMLLARYTELLFIMAAQSVACTKLHPVRQRAARALLQWYDRLQRPVIPVTQDMLADALGIRRASVTVALAELEDTGAIARGRGRVTVEDKRRLEGEVCECYGVIEDAFARDQR